MRGGVQAVERKNDLVWTQTEENGDEPFRCAPPNLFPCSSTTMVTMGSSGHFGREDRERSENHWLFDEQRRRVAPIRLLSQRPSISRQC